MKTSCNIIRDLLPLYHDKVCSKESCILVEEHIEQCEDCKKLLKNIAEDVSHPTVTEDEAKPIKAIASIWQRERMKWFLKGTLIAALICGALIAAFCGMTQWKCIPVSTDLLEVSEVSQLADGRIIYHLSVKDNKELHFIKFTTNEDGSYYMTPMRSFIESERTMDRGLFNDYFTVDVAENNAWQQHQGGDIEITSCYIGPKDDGILIWEKGTALPAASEELEKMVSSN